MTVLFQNPQFDRYDIHSETDDVKFKHLVYLQSLQNMKNVRGTVDFLTTERQKMHQSFNQLCDTFTTTSSRQEAEKIKAELSKNIPFEEMDNKLRAALDQEKIDERVLNIAKSKMPDGTSTKTLSCDFSMDETKTGWGNSSKFFEIIRKHIEPIVEKHGQEKITFTEFNHWDTSQPMLKVHFDSVIQSEVERAFIRAGNETVVSLRDHVSENECTIAESRQAWRQDGQIFHLNCRDNTNYFHRISNTEAGNTPEQVKQHHFKDDIEPNRNSVVPFNELGPHYVLSNEHPNKQEVDNFYMHGMQGRMFDLDYECDSAAFLMLENITRSDMQSTNPDLAKRANKVIEQLEKKVSREFNREREMDMHGLYSQTNCPTSLNF